MYCVPARKACFPGLLDDHEIPPNVLIEQLEMVRLKEIKKLSHYGLRACNPRWPFFFRIIRKWWTSVEYLRVLSVFS